MTKHSDVDNKCKHCGTFFVPIPEAPNCPKCNRKSDVIFNDFLKDTIRSVMFNLKGYHGFLPLAWRELKIGDYYFWVAFNVLNYVALRLGARKSRLLYRKISQGEVYYLTLEFLEAWDFGEQSYSSESFKTYLPLLLNRDHEELQSLRWVLFPIL